jgi:phosphopantothenoylcysteine synthetase/decarboxylase
MKLLITSGPTREPIDSVRYISNFSSGQTGRALGNFFSDRGFEVVSLYGQGSARPERVERTLEFRSFNDLNFLLRKVFEEEEFDFVIHLPAVSDYSMKEVTKGKIESGSEELHLTLKKNFKILDRIKSYALVSGKEPMVVGFKLTDNIEKDIWLKAAQKVYKSGQVDLVVHNDLSEYSEKTEEHRFRIVDKEMKISECQSILELGQELEKVFRRVGQRGPTKEVVL